MGVRGSQRQPDRPETRTARVVPREPLNGHRPLKFGDLFDLAKKFGRDAMLGAVPRKGGNGPSCEVVPSRTSKHRSHRPRVPPLAGPTQGGLRASRRPAQTAAGNPPGERSRTTCFLHPPSIPLVRKGYQSDAFADRLAMLPQCEFDLKNIYRTHAT
jgi:hypothetical protein